MTIDEPQQDDDPEVPVDGADAPFEGDPFFELGIAPSIVDDIAAQGLTVPTPIQRDAIPVILEGRDLIGLAQTGTGKTAAYLLPLLHGLLEKRKASTPRSTSILVLVPTRELAYQVSDSIKAFSGSLKVRYLTIVGGERYDHQFRSLKRGVDVLVATPGRFEDLMARGKVDLDDIEHFVLDEGDQMIDLGFLPPIRRIFEALPQSSQTVFFSATMPDEMKRLAETFLNDPVTIKAERAGETVDAISQRAVLVRNADKRDVLFGELGRTEGEQALIFVRTRLRADELAAWLTEKGIDSDALHGDMRQYIRQKVLRRFKKGELRLLVATDVAARGIDVSGLGLVVNYDLPEMVESYVHRIGRTGRAGRDGEALSFCSVADQEKLSAILAHVGQRLVIVDGDGNEVTDFQPEIAPRKGRGRGRPARRFRDGKPGGRPGGKSGGRPGGKPGGNPAARPKPQSEDRHADVGAGKPRRNPDGKPFSKGAGKPSSRPQRGGGRPDGTRDSGAPRAARPGSNERKPDRKAERRPDKKPEVGRDQTLRLKDGAAKPKHGKKPFRKGARPAGGGRGGKGGGFGGSQPLRRRSGNSGRPARNRP
ncbi:MAG: DEAD/DEAH box helicase [Pseudomonadota bacterium]|nr:DEAD/DEAH box helicase [Pseudomonadota bacterium]